MQSKILKTLHFTLSWNASLYFYVNFAIATLKTLMMANSVLKISPSDPIFAFIQHSASSTIWLQLKEISIPILAKS